MSTLPVVEEILHESGQPMSVREIVEWAKGRLPTRSKTPDTVVARDLSMDIKRLGAESRFARVAPGRYTMRALVSTSDSVETSSDAPVESSRSFDSARDARPQSVPASNSTNMLVSAMSAIGGERPGVIPAKSQPQAGASESSSG